MINWILQENLTQPAVLEAIKNALNGVDESWEMVSIVPFSTDLPPIQHPDRFNIIYGSTTFMLNAFEDTALRKGVFFDPDTFRMSHYVAQWHHHVLNADGILTTFGRLGALRSAPDQPWFVRPDNDGKAFSGRVETFAELQAWSDRVCHLDLPDLSPNTPVWVAAPKVLQKEWRLFVVDDVVVSASRYMEAGRLRESATDLPSGMLKFAQARIAEYRLADVYALDIAQVADGYKLIECNCFNGTGFYQHDIPTIIRAVNAFVKTHYNAA